MRRVRTKIEPKKVKGRFPAGPVEFDFLFGGIPLLICREGWDDISFDLVPYPYMEIPTNRGMFDLKELYRSQFMHCVKGWEGLYDDEGNPLECTQENKEWVFNYDKQLRDFVIEEIQEMEESRGQALKNC